MSTQVNMTARDWAAGKGHCKANSRGRLPNAAKDAIAQAEAEGMVFLAPDYLTGVKPSTGGAVRPSAVLGIPEETETLAEAVEALSESARARQAKLLSMTEDEAFDWMSHRRVSFIEGNGRKIIVTVSGRRDLFRFENSKEGRVLGISSDQGFRTFLIERLVNVARIDTKAQADFRETWSRATATQRKRWSRAA